MEYVNEKTSCKIRVTFKDEDKAAVTPSSGTYSLYDELSGTVILAPTAFTPTSNIHDFNISATQNQIIDSTKAFEVKLLTLTYNYGISKSGTEEYRYRVRNLNRIS